MHLEEQIFNIARRYLQKVSRSGAMNIMALCPFHEDSRASFAMNVSNGVYCCHGCGAKGTLGQFLRDVGVPRTQIEVEYKRTVEAARNALPRKEDALRPGVHDLEELPEPMLGQFDGFVLENLLNSGFKESTIKSFDIGFDRVHRRITYPIRDLNGKLVAISGRTIYPDVAPRYKFYDKEFETFGVHRTGAWNKRKVLYNMHRVYPSAMSLDTKSMDIIIVEGFKACMWLWQCGLKNTVALMGASLSWEQKWILGQFSGRIFVFLDNNDAGQSGTREVLKSLAGKIQLDDRGTLWVRCAPSSLHVIEYPERLKNDPKAQPDSLTELEVWVQYLDALSYSDWLMK